MLCKYFVQIIMLTFLNWLLTVNILASLVFLDFESLEPVVVRLMLLQKHLMLVSHQGQAHIRPSMNIFLQNFGELATIRLHFEEKNKVNYNTKLYISHASILQHRVFLKRFCYDMYLQKYIVARSKYLVLNRFMQNYVSLLYSSMS